MSQRDTRAAIGATAGLIGAVVASNAVALGVALLAVEQWPDLHSLAILALFVAVMMATWAGALTVLFRVAGRRGTRDASNEPD